MLTAGRRAPARLIQWGIVSSPEQRLVEIQRTAVRELMRVAPVIDEVGRRFTRAGHTIALVGGSVRDALLGRLVDKDLDFATSATPDQIEACLAGWTDAVWDIGREFGTIGARVGDMQLEITTYRADIYDATSRKPAVTFGDTLVGDLTRRDFTVNAMAYELGSREFVDPFDGQGDLAAGVLRTPVTPEQSF